MARSILLVFAHPDDESLGAAGSVSRYAAEGVLVDLVCATRGEQGGRVGVSPGGQTGAAREAELRAAAAIMGIRKIHFLGYSDGHLQQTDPGELAGRIAEVMRSVRPDVVITFGPDGVTGHADHIAVGSAVSRAFELIASANGFRPKLYWVTLPDSSGLEVTTRAEAEITTVIDISGFLGKKIEAISAHRSQADAARFGEIIQGEKTPEWATKEYFVLANGQVKGKETDLFEQCKPDLPH